MSSYHPYQTQYPDSPQSWRQTKADLRPDLRELVERAANGIFFSRKTGDAAVDALSQGEQDVLERVAEILGWRSLESLAVKYFPKFPNRKMWLEAMRRVSKYSRLRNITYFLLCLQTIEKEFRAAALASKEGFNRLVHNTNNRFNKGTNRLVPQASNSGGTTDKYVILKYPGLVRVGGAPA